MRIYLATKNPGKVREFAGLLAESAIDVRHFDGYRDPVEGETSYPDNAALKARALHAQLRDAGVAFDGVLADDSGIEVAALGGRPGVNTAYYGGTELSWDARCALLIREVDATGARDRRCRFVCALHFVAASGAELGSFATVDGVVADAPRGRAGMGFDPVFRYPALGLTFAEMDEAQKHGVSHRGIALATLLGGLRAAGYEA